MASVRRRLAACACRHVWAPPAPALAGKGSAARATDFISELMSDVNAVGGVGESESS
jgi:hypothetical protein